MRLGTRDVMENSNGPSVPGSLAFCYILDFPCERNKISTRRQERRRDPSRDTTFWGEDQVDLWKTKKVSDPSLGGQGQFTLIVLAKS